jgi:xanthine/CO dehydrogenase XdhC/CoxF family maturation factor
MNEWRRIERLARKALARREPAVVAHLVDVEGSHFRRPGASGHDRGGESAGTISGGCLEADLRRRMPEVLAARPLFPSSTTPERPVTRSGEQGWLRRQARDPALRALAGPRADTALAVPGGEAGWCATVVRAGGETARPGEQFARRGLKIVSSAGAEFRRAIQRRAEVPSGLREWQIGGREVTVLVESWEPAVRLVLLGSGEEIAALAVLAGPLGWQVELAGRASRNAAVAAGRIGRPLRSELDWPALCHARTAVVIATHSLADDAAFVADAVATPARYIGILGSRRRVERILALACTPAAAGRIFGPAGLDIGGESPAEIAISIASEVQAVLHARPGRSLSSSSGPIHERSILSAAEPATRGEPTIFAPTDRASPSKACFTRSEVSR